VEEVLNCKVDTTSICFSIDIQWWKRC